MVAADIAAGVMQARRKGLHDSLAACWHDGDVTHGITKERCAQTHFVGSKLRLAVLGYMP